MTEKRDQRHTAREKALKNHERRPYITPELIEYGHIEKLTEAQASGPWADAKGGYVRTG
jgi:hypothetical protein